MIWVLRTLRYQCAEAVGSFGSTGGGRLGKGFGLAMQALIAIYKINGSAHPLYLHLCKYMASLAMPKPI